MNPKILATSIGMFLLLTSIAFAIPSQPHNFYGTVTVNGASAPDGTIVSARINGIEVANTTTLDGRFGYGPLFYVPDTDPSTRQGSTITFFVDDVNTGVTETFCTACFNDCGTDSDCSPLELSVTVESTSETTTTNGGGSTVSSTTTVIPETDNSNSNDETEEGCQEKWTCSAWGECVNGIQTRTCTDQNSCGTNSNEPFSSQPCSSIEAESNEETPDSPTGFFLFTPTNLVIGSVVAVIIFVSLFFLLRRRSETIMIPPKTLL